VSHIQDTVSEAPSLMDRINRKTWSDPATVSWYRHLEGWTDPGERAAVEQVSAEARDKRILDLGVGGGRTVPLLRRISRDYTGIDYTGALVDACREKYPDARVLHGDARDLSRFDDGSFDLVVFSFNGIDAVNHEDRLTILREIRRVLCPGGSFLFSAHNRRGPTHGERHIFSVYYTRNPFKLAVRVARAVARAPRAFLNYRRNSKLAYTGDGYSLTNAAAHAHGIVVHYTSLDAELRELEGAGFRPGPLVFDNVTGRRLALDGDTTGVSWFHFVVRG
jgi:SAM-dependent methyltransferase